MTIIFENLSKKYAQKTKKEVAALEELNFRVEENEFVAIVGPSGCGKTTLLKIVAGLVTPDSGRIVYTNLKGSKKPNALMVFQEQGLLPWLTVLDNIGLGLKLQKFPKEERSKQVLQFMEKVNLVGFESHFPHELSGGMRQRVALARAFLSNPDILLMDEPFASLDAQTRLILQEELLNIWRAERKTVLFVTHDIEEAILLSDRIIVLTDRPGKIQEEIIIEIERPRDLTARDHPFLKETRWKIWKILEQEVRKDLKLV